MASLRSQFVTLNHTNKIDMGEKKTPLEALEELSEKITAESEKIELLLNSDSLNRFKSKLGDLSRFQTLLRANYVFSGIMALVALFSLLGAFYFYSVAFKSKAEIINEYTKNKVVKSLEEAHRDSAYQETEILCSKWANQNPKAGTKLKEFVKKNRQITIDN